MTVRWSSKYTTYSHTVGGKGKLCCKTSLSDVLLSSRENFEHFHNLPKLKSRQNEKYFLHCSWIKNQLSNYHFLIKKVFHSTKMELSSFVSFEVLISTYWAFYDIELKRRSRQATISFLSSSALFPLFVPNSICGRHFFFAAQNSTATPFLHTSQDFPDAFLA